MSDAKRYASVKKVSLAGLSEQWDEDCFAYVVPATYEDNKATMDRDFSSMTPQDQVDYQLKFVRDRFISGKIRTFDGAEFALVDMTPEDTGASIAINDHLYAEIMGLDLDPKAIRKEAQADSLQTTSESSTETSSSES